METRARVCQPARGLRPRVVILKTDARRALLPGPASRASAESRFIATRLSSALHNAPQRDVAMPRCESCGRVVGLCACPPGPNEMGEGPLRRGYDGVARAARVDARLASATTPTPPPPRPRPLHPAEAHVGLEFRPPDPEDLAPFDEFNRRRAVERAWEAEAAAAVPGGRRHSQDPVRLGRHYWRAGRAEICAGGTRGKTMHDAAAEDAAEAIRRRLRRGEHPDQSDFLRRTPTHVAAAGGCAGAADALLEAGADPNAPDVAGRTPLHHASLANCGGVVGPETHAVFPEVSRRSTETSNERSTYPSRVPSPPPPPPPPASRRPRTDVIARLVEGGANLDARDDAGKTPTHLAALRGHFTVARALLDAGADPDARDARGRRPVDESRACGCDAMARMLSRYARWRDTPDESARRSESQVTGGARRDRLAPSRRAPSDDERAKGESLDADSATRISLPAPRSRGGRTALHEAAARGALDDVLALLRAGADPCARDDAGRNATHHAAAATGARGSSGPAAAAAAAATVRALLDAIDAVPAAPAGAFAKAREPSTPPWDARDLAGRRPVDLCRDGDVAATFRRRRENLERRRRHAGGTPRPDQSRVSSTKPVEWARRAEDARRRAAAWPADAAERAVALAHDILRAVEDTAESRDGHDENGHDENGHDENGRACATLSNRARSAADRLRHLLGRKTHARVTESLRRWDEAAGGGRGGECRSERRVDRDSSRTSPWNCAACARN